MTIWRIPVSDQPVQRLDFVNGEPEILAAWTRTQVFFLDAATGDRLGERIFDYQRSVEDRSGDDWRAFLNGLTAPNNAPLPLVRLAHITIHSGEQGRLYLLQIGRDKLYFDANSKETRLDTPGEVSFAAVGLDRALGLVAALDSGGGLHLYQQHMRVGTFNIGLTPRDDLRPAVLVSNEGTAIFVCDGQRIALTNASGRVRRHLDLHYPASEVACSPDGRRLAVCEDEIGVIRVYDGTTLQPLRQRFAIDLLTEARRPPLRRQMSIGKMGLNALALNSKGRLAFALAGIVCMSSIARMTVIPQPGA